MDSGKRFGDKRVSCVGLFLMVIGGVVLGLSRSYQAAFAGRLVAGIGAVLFNVMVTKMVTDWFIGREIRTALGILLGSWPCGLALGLRATDDADCAPTPDEAVLLENAVRWAGEKH